jgi:hypothetical protein
VCGASLRWWGCADAGLLVVVTLAFSKEVGPFNGAPLFSWKNELSLERVLRLSRFCVCTVDFDDDLARTRSKITLLLHAPCLLSLSALSLCLPTFPKTKIRTLMIGGGGR